jgi:glyoxylase-like metal-dependent hydrolase (beta-lactamase superfamily II)
MTDPIRRSWHSTPISRREALAGAAALAGMAALPGAVWAQPKPHSFKQGDLEIVVVTDGQLVLPAEVVAPDAPPEELKALLASMGQGPAEVRAETNAVLIRTGSDLILVDTGAGASFGATAGKLPETLGAAGVDAGSITKVVFTHAHLDHIGGSTVTGDALRYPNASYYIGAVERDFWMDPGLLSRMPQEMQGLVTGAQQNLMAMKDRLTLLKSGDEIVSGVRVLDTPGHTPGHMSLELDGNEVVLITGDAITNPVVFFAHPEWRFGFDADPAVAVETRRKMLDRAAAERIKLLGYHWPYPGLGYAERKDGAFRYTPAS